MTGDTKDKQNVLGLHQLKGMMKNKEWHKENYRWVWSWNLT